MTDSTATPPADAELRRGIGVRPGTAYGPVVQGAPAVTAPAHDAASPPS